jgi:hypothetical protein
VATKHCSKCGVSKPLSEYWMKRPEKGQHYSQCKACLQAKNRAWLKRNPHKNAEYWKKNDPAHMRAVYREMKRRQRLNPHRRLRMYISNAVAGSLSGRRKSKPTFDLLGYTLDELRAHLELQFLPGMSWQNYGEWHVDHIVPLAEFSISGTECPEFRSAWSLANLRPLWGADNVRKRDRRTHLL